MIFLKSKSAVFKKGLKNIGL